MDGLVALLATNDVRMLAVLAIAAGVGRRHRRAHDARPLRGFRRVRGGVRGPVRRRREPSGRAPRAALPAGAAVRGLDRGQLDELLDPHRQPGRVRQGAASRSPPPSTPSTPPPRSWPASAGRTPRPTWPSSTGLGVKGSIDAIGFHPYAPDAASIVGLTQQIRATLVTRRRPQPADRRHRDRPTRRTPAPPPTPPGRPSCRSSATRWPAPTATSRASTSTPWSAATPISNPAARATWASWTYTTGHPTSPAKPSSPPAALADQPRPAAWCSATPAPPPRACCRSA